MLVGAERDVLRRLDNGERFGHSGQIDAASDHSAVLEDMHAVTLIGEVPQQEVCFR